VDPGPGIADLGLWIADCGISFNPKSAIRNPQLGEFVRAVGVRADGYDLDARLTSLMERS
jgi:hypothetical protein